MRTLKFFAVIVAITLSFVPGFVAGRWSALVELRERVAVMEGQLTLLGEVCR